MIAALCYCLAWEWINIALEYTVVSWVRLPRLFLTVAGVNLATHPLFTLLLVHFGRSPRFVVPCEVVIFLVEWALLVAVYGRNRWRRLGLTAFVMNAASYGTGVLIAI